MLASALEHLVAGIVDHPADVHVDSRPAARGEVLEVRVHPADLGRVIGRSGRTAKALRTVIGALAAGRPVRVDVVDVDRQVARGRARSAESQLRVGRLTKAHGLKGGLKLELFTDDPGRRFTPGASFSLQVPDESPWHGKRLQLSELRWYNGHPVGFFADVTDRTAAESLAKAILWVDTDPEEPAEPDAWYDHQLIGLDVVRDGTSVGTVDRLEHLPAQDLLVVLQGDREVLVPFVRAIVPEVDLKAGRVVVTPPAGLFEDPAADDETPPTEAERAAVMQAGIEGGAAVEIDEPQPEAVEPVDTGQPADAPASAEAVRG